MAFGLGRQSVTQVAAPVPPVQVFPGVAAVQVTRVPEVATTETAEIPPVDVVKERRSKFRHRLLRE